MSYKRSSFSLLYWLMNLAAIETAIEYSHLVPVTLNKTLLINYPDIDREG